jgi:hypothetical protein
MARGNHRWLGRLGILLSAVAVLLLAGVLFIASKLGGDEEVLNDIDRHFQDLDKTSSYASFYNAERRGTLEARSPDDGPAVESDSLKKAAKPRTAARAGRRSKKKHRRGDKSPPKEAKETGFEGIRNIAPGTYLLDEALVAAARKQPRAFARGVRARLVSENGQPAGFQLAGIAPSSAIHAIGLRSGDVLLAVNGYRLRSIDEAVLAATSLRFADKFRVDVKRGAQNRSFYYRVATD